MNEKGELEEQCYRSCRCRTGEVICLTNAGELMQQSCGMTLWQTTARTEICDSGIRTWQSKFKSRIEQKENPWLKSLGLFFVFGGGGGLSAARQKTPPSPPVSEHLSI